MTAPTQPNAELAYATLDQIDAHPELWSQDWWFTVTDCGTVGCFAGWACVLSGDKPTAGDRPLCMVAIGDDVSFVQRPDGERLYASDRALDLLGIGREVGRRLFDGRNTREDLGRLVAEIFGPRPAAWPISQVERDRAERGGLVVDDEYADLPPNAGSTS